MGTSFFDFSLKFECINPPRNHILEIFQTANPNSRARSHTCARDPQYATKKLSNTLESFSSLARDTKGRVLDHRPR